MGLQYHSPHKFRHGNAVYSLKQSQDVADLKAVSQNLMHSNLSITDGVYGILSNQDVVEKIASLGGKAKTDEISQAEIVNQMEYLLKQLKQKFGK